MNIWKNSMGVFACFNSVLSGMTLMYSKHILVIFSILNNELNDLRKNDLF